MVNRFVTPDTPFVIQPPDTPKKPKTVTWIDGGFTQMPNGNGLQDPTQVTASATSMNRLRELRYKFEKWRRKKENVKNTIKKHPKKKRRTFQINSDSSESEYLTDHSQNTNFNESSDGWDDSSEEELTPDPQWDTFMAKLLQNHKTPKKTSTQVYSQLEN